MINQEDIKEIKMLVFHYIVRGGAVQHVHEVDSNSKVSFEDWANNRGYRYWWTREHNQGNWEP